MRGEGSGVGAGAGSRLVAGGGVVRKLPEEREGSEFITAVTVIESQNEFSFFNNAGLGVL